MGHADSAASLRRCCRSAHALPAGVPRGASESQGPPPALPLHPWPWTALSHALLPGAPPARRLCALQETLLLLPAQAACVASEPWLREMSAACVALNRGSERCLQPCVAWAHLTQRDVCSHVWHGHISALWGRELPCPAFRQLSHSRSDHRPPSCSLGLERVAWTNTALCLA